jgi:hypothetical protein
MPKCTRAGFNTGNLVRVWVAPENAVRGTHAIQFCKREVALIGEQSIEREATMPFAENAAIAAGPLRVLGFEAKDIVIEHAEHIDGRECRSDVPTASALEHPHDEAAKLSGAFIKQW